MRPYLRALLLAVLLFNIVGILAELFLLDHIEGFWQWTPVVVMIFSVLTVGATLVRSNPLNIFFLKLSMALFILTGSIGVGLHYLGNMEFEREMYPSITGWQLIWESLRGATPVLAPGTMVGLGLLGLVCTRKND